jgi:hypothetical protein
MIPLNPLVVGLASIPVFFLSIFAHELGHAIAGHAAGYIITSLGLGVARPLWVGTVRGVRVFVCRVKTGNGLTFAFHPELLPSRGRMVVFLAGGILVNLVLVLVSLALVAWLAWGRSVWFAVLWINALLVLVAMVPGRYKVGRGSFRSDGALILLTLRSGSYAQQPVMTAQAVEFMHGLATSIGDATLTHLNLLGGAEAWIALGDTERAAALLEREQALPDCGSPSIRGLGHLVRARQAMANRQLDEADTQLDAAAAAFPPQAAEGASFLGALLRAAVRLARGDASGAVDVEALLSGPVLARRPAMESSVIALRLAAAVGATDVAAVDRIMGEYETHRQRFPSVSTDLAIARDVARFHAARGDLAAAEPVYRRVCESIGEIAGALVSKEERWRFLERQTDLTEEARQCFLSLGKADEAERLLILRDLEEVRKEAARVRNRRLRSAGLRVLLLDVLVLAVDVALLGQAPTSQSPPFLLVALDVGVFTIPAVLYLLFDITVGRLIPVLRESGGAVLLVLACCPWLCLILTLGMVFLFR